MPCIGRALLVFLGLNTCSALRLDNLDDTSSDKPGGLIREFKIVPHDPSIGEKCIFTEWGSTQYLEGVQILPTRTDPVLFENFNHGSDNKEGLFVYPQKDLAMCIIEKVGCSSWLTIWNKMVLNKPLIKSPWYGVVPFHWSDLNALQVFRSPTSTRILWVRDPLERFLSGFLDKCAVLDDTMNRYKRICSFHTFNDIYNPPGFPLSKVQQWFRDGHTIADADTHFTPQSWHCELKKRFTEYNIIGLMTKANFSRDAGCIMQRANLSYVNEQGGDHGLPYFNKPANPSQAEWQNTEILKRFYTKEFANFLLEVYKEDYELFRLKKPDWVEQATGEWFYQRPEALRRKLENKKKEQEEKEEDDIMRMDRDRNTQGNEEDDLWALAAMNGFRLTA